MDKDYLLEEVIASIDELAPFSNTLVTQSAQENTTELSKTLKEIELIAEHLNSFVVALKKVA